MQFFQNKTWKRRMIMVMYGTIILLMLTVILQSVLYQEPRVYTDTMGNWIDEQGNSIELTEFSNGEEGQSAYLRLEHIPANQTLLFRCRNMYIEYKVNGEMLYSDRQDIPKIFGKTPGSRWYQFSLPISDAETMIEIHGTPCYDNSKGYIDNVYIGTTVDVTSKIMKSKFVGFLVDFIWVVFGAMLILIYLLLHNYYHISKDFLYLSLGSFFCALWCSTENTMWQYFIGHSEMFHLIGYLAMMAIPFTFGLLSAERLEGRWQKWGLIYSEVNAGCVMVITVLHLVGIAEYHYTMDIIYVLLILLFPFAFKLVQSYTREISHKKNFYILLVAFSFMVILVGIGIQHYLTGQYSDYADYIQYALIVFLFMLMLYQVMGLNGIMKKGLESELMHELSLLDHLTKFYNRSGFAEHGGEYETHLSEHRPMGVIQFDVNNLKAVNDNQGHEKGDELICLASSGIYQSFGSYGKCYRMGGDEFLIILTGENPKADYETGRKNLEIYCDYANSMEERTFDINIAHGFTMVSPSESLSAAMARADELMYENKRWMKAQK